MNHDVVVEISPCRRYHRYNDNDAINISIDININDDDDNNNYNINNNKFKCIGYRYKAYDSVDHTSDITWIIINTIPVIKNSTDDNIIVINDNFQYYFDVIKFIEDKYSLKYLHSWISSNKLYYTIITTDNLIKSNLMIKTRLQSRYKNDNHDYNDNNSEYDVIDKINNVNDDIVDTNCTDCTQHWKPSIGLHLPTMRALLLHDQEYHRIYLNTMEPTSFSTDLFEGKMHLLVNSKFEKDPYFIDLFQRDKYSFQIQIQGKFKKQPNGMLYIGAEITKKMDLGKGCYFV
jgi:hypothetical protein